MHARAQFRLAGGVHEAVARELLIDEGLSPPDSTAGTDASTFVGSQLAAMPQHLRAGAALLGGLFAAAAIVRGRKATLEPAVLRRLTRAWGSSRVPALGDYLRLLRSPALLYLYETEPLGPGPVAGDRD